MTRRRLRAAVRSTLLAICAVVAVACGAAQQATGDVARVSSTAPTVGGVASADADPAPTTDVVAGDADDTGVVDGVSRPIERSLRPIVDRSVAHLAERLGVPPDRVDVVLAQAVTWPDAHLGCAVRGADETLGDPQPGTRVHLRVDDRLYRYHTGGRREGPFLCDPAAAKSEEQQQRIEP